MKIRKLLFALTAFLLIFPMVTYAQDFNVIGEPSLYDVPKALSRTDSSLWDQDFKNNPALLDPGSDYELIMDVYYSGSAIKASADFNYGAIYPTIFYGGSLDAKCRINSVGTDIGFIKELHDGASLGLIFNYNREDINGDGSFIHTITAPAGFGIINGSLDAESSSNTFALSVLYDINLSDTVSLGAGVTYAYINRRLNYEENATGAWNVVNPENVSIDTEMTFDYHLISPVLGISIEPIDGLVLNSSVTPSIYVGSVDKVSSLFNDFNESWFGPGFGLAGTYTEDLDSNDLFVFDFDYMLDGEYDVIADRLSLPFFFNFTYGVAEWSVDGVASGYYTAFIHYAPFQGPGPIAYENKTEHWTISVGGGVHYTIGGYDLSALMGYSHIDLKNSYSMENDVVSSILIFVGGSTIGGLSVFHHTVEETRDILSLELGVSTEFNENFSGDFSARYDIGWVNMGTDTYCTSQFDYRNGIGSVNMSLGDKEEYHDLTLATSLAYSPVENLHLSLGGMVKIPLSGIDYNLGGDTAGISPGVIVWRWYFGGAASMDMGYRGWDYGGMFNIEYAF